MQRREFCKLIAAATAATTVPTTEAVPQNAPAADWPAKRTGLTKRPLPI